MNANTGAFTPNAGAPGTQFLTGTGFLPQLLLAIVLLLILHVTLFAAESMYRQYMKYDKAVKELMPLTYSAENRSYVINQDPFDPNSVPISLSDNERTGLEFSYSFHVFVNPSTFKSGKMHWLTYSIRVTVGSTHYLLPVFTCVQMKTLCESI